MPETILGLIITGILSGIGVGFKVLWLRITAEADECKKDRKQLWDKVDEVEERISSCPQPACPIRPKWTSNTNSATTSAPPTGPMHPAG